MDVRGGTVQLDVHSAATRELPEGLLAELRSFLGEAFGPEFTEDDWAHGLGGHHVWRRDEAGLVAHACVVPRRLSCAGRVLGVGYVEAVATRADVRRRGHGTAVMTRLAEILGARYELGALSSSTFAFYANLGWETWRGPTWMAPVGELASRSAWTRTEDDDGGIMVLRTPRTPTLDLAEPVACEWRVGDVW